MGRCRGHNRGGGRQWSLGSSLAGKVYSIRRWVDIDLYSLEAAVDFNQGKRLFWINFRMLFCDRDGLTLESWHMRHSPELGVDVYYETIWCLNIFVPIQKKRDCSSVLMIYQNLTSRRACQSCIGKRHCIAHKVKLFLLNAIFIFGPLWQRKTLAINLSKFSDEKR